MKKHKISAKENKKMAEKRIRQLFEEAQKAYKKEPKLSDRYVSLAKKMSSKYKVPIPKKYKSMHCKKCLSFLVPSVNLRVRTHRGHVVYLCEKCKSIRRVPYKK